MFSFARWIRPIYIFVIVAFAGALLFLSAMNRDLNHDEHQFIAPGVLLSRTGALPYRDFPIFHLPNLVLVYAALDQLTHQPILAAKILSTAASVGVVALLLLVATCQARTTPANWQPLLIGGCAVVLLLCDQLFVFTAGKTWNHEVPAFLLVAGIVLQSAAQPSRSLFLVAASGLCIGLAIGTRITYLPVAGAFLLLLFFFPGEGDRTRTTCAAWLAGCALGLGPTLYFFLTQREAFLFDNFTFPRQRLLDLSDTRVQKTATWWRKIRFFGKEIVTHSLPLFAAAALAAWQPLRSAWRERTKCSYLVLLTAAVLPFTVLGCFLPSRYQYQHYFALAPLLALLVAAGASIMDPTSTSSRFRLSGLLLCTVLSLCAIGSDSGKRAGGLKAYTDLSTMWNHQNWFTTHLQDDYTFAGGIHGRILTLAPAGVLQGGGEIYPELATGPFGWRGASAIPKEKRRQLHFLVPDDLEEFLGKQPPAAILTGLEDAELEAPLVRYARMHEFAETKLSRRRLLWLPKSLDHAGAIPASK